MDSSSHHRGNRPAGPGSGLRHVAQRLHPALTDVLNRLDGTPIGDGFKQRAVDVSTSTFSEDPVDRSEALAAHRWLLDRADGDGLPLTAAGYLTPADVKALAEVLPTMQDGTFAMASEADVYPVLDFSDYLKAIGLLRTYKASLRLTREGRVGLADADRLWGHLEDTLVLTDSDFDIHASIVVLVHMATTKVGIDGDEVAETMTALGWSHPGGAAVRRDEISPVWDDLWTALGNVGERVGTQHGDGHLSPAARALIHDTLFDEVETG